MRLIFACYFSFFWPWIALLTKICLQLFEKVESGDSSIDSTDDKGTFDRQTNQRSSIAERRRMYEKKSQSVAEEKPVSPALK